MKPIADARPYAPAGALLERWPTGAKVFLILSIALLPIAVIAIFATLQTTRAVADETRMRLRGAATESSRAIATELVGDVAALRAVVDALARDGADAPSCARAQGVFAQQFVAGTRFAVIDRRGALLCGERLGTAPGTRPAAGRVGARIAGEDLELSVAAPGGVRGVVVFPAEFLQRLGRPGTLDEPYGLALLLGEDRLTLHTLAPVKALERRESKRVPLGVAGLDLEMQVRSAPISSPMLIAMMLPLVMWFAAASTAWFVVDRLLIRPLRALRTAVAAYRPGEVIDPATIRGLPAQEIRELGDTFRAISRTVVLHEAGLAEGLVRQTRLTREVHHRVKNNLQVIASLINLHARGATTPEARLAYASIQRRVDALAVVHRNHFAEMEDNRGLALRGMVGELAANLRANTPEGSALGIVVDIDPFFVTQDVAVAVAFLVTEVIELALMNDSCPRMRISVSPAPAPAPAAVPAPAAPSRATLRLSSPALIESDAMRDRLAQRYGRVIEGLARQLRAPLRYEPLTGAYEIEVSVIGRE